MMVSPCLTQIQTRLVNKGFQYWSSLLKVFLPYPVTLIPDWIRGCYAVTQSSANIELHAHTFMHHIITCFSDIVTNVRKHKSYILKRTCSIQKTRSKACFHSLPTHESSCLFPLHMKKQSKQHTFTKVPEVNPVQKEKKG